MGSEEDKKLLHSLEELTLSKENLILRLTGFVLNKEGAKEPLEILVFKGFSSCTTHPTESNPDLSILPNNATLIQGEILKAPIEPSKELRVFGPVAPSLLLDPLIWCINT